MRPIAGRDSSEGTAVLFKGLLARLRDRVRERIRNGELTERGLARRAGLSQPHVHNVLKGARVLTPATADRILECLEMSVADLLGPAGGRRGAPC